MKLFVKGTPRREVTLTQKDFIAQGGQGAIYGKGDLVYKVYHDPKTMIAPSKIYELEAISDPAVIRPKDLLLDDHNALVGFTLRWVRDAHPFCKLFTKAFKQRENVTADHVKGLVQKMRQTVGHIHDKKILIVDLNEMNFLVTPTFEDIYFIDVDSYQTKSFPATVLMDSVRDRHTKSFSEVTDWFSFGIVTFQLFVGIHPFKGKHPKVQYQEGAKTLDERMFQNLSVLNKDVSVPASCYPFDVIPSGYRDWYQRIFEKGERLPPPEHIDQAAGVIILSKLPPGTKTTFKTQPFYKTTGDVLGFYSDKTSTSWAALRRSGSKLTLAVQGKNDFDLPLKGMVTVVFTDRFSTAVVASHYNGLLSVYDLKDLTAPRLSYPASEVMSYDNRLYFKAHNAVYEVEIYDSARPLVGSKLVANVLEQSTSLFSGVAVQNLLGTYYVSLFPVSGSSKQVRLKELDGYQVIEAKYAYGVLMIIAAKQGSYTRFVYRWSADFDKSSVWKYDVPIGALNFVVLPSGVCLCLNEEDKIEMFRVDPSKTEVKILEDSHVEDSRLYNFGTTALYSRGDEIARFSLT